MKLSKFLVFVCVLPSLTVSPIEPCKAEGLSFDLKPNPVRWISGPDKASLADVAEIEIPAGYRFTDARGARTLLESMKNPVPENLVGLLTPDNGGGWIMFEFTPIGFVKDEDAKKIDSDALLKSIRSTTEQQNQHRGMQNLPSVAVVVWELKPSYDPDKHILEWAIRAEYGSEVVLNHTVRLLGRNGVLDAIAVAPPGTQPDLTALKRLLKCVSFISGERYADFKPGDKVALSGLVELIKDDGSLDSQEALAVSPEGAETSILKSAWPWFIVSALGVGGALALRRRIKRRSRSQDAHPLRAAPQMHSKQMVVAKASNGLHESVSSPPSTPDTRKPALTHRSSKRRKRMFNYQKFYTDMMMQSSSVTYSTGLVLRNGNHTESNGFDSDSHSHTNGNGNHNGEGRILNETVVLQATSELIASQKALIHEQARLIEDQSRLIEEKYRLLERQSELLDAELTEN